MEIKTEVRRSWSGITYRIYIDGAYRATAFSAREIEPLIAQLTTNK